MANSNQRLALFISSMHGGGAQRVMLNLAQGIAERGYDVDLVLARAEGPYLAQVSKSVRIVDLGAQRVLASLPGLVHYLRSEKPAVLLSAIHYVNIVALFAQHIARTSTRLVVSEHSVLSHTTQSSSSWRGRFIMQLSYFYHWANGIVAVSQEAGNNLARITGIPSDRIHVIYNPVVTPELQRKAQAPLSHPWFEPDSPPVLLAVGRLSKVKDFPTLIRAFALVREYRTMRLIILGDGEERPELEKLIKQLGLEKDVSLPGFIDNPYPYMTRASVFVLSSKHEALPTVLVEALYCGLPLVATNSPGGTREILRNGQYGQLVPVGDVMTLAQAITTALKNGIHHPHWESWRPFESNTVVDQYLRILLGK